MAAKNNVRPHVRFQPEETFKLESVIKYGKDSVTVLPISHLSWL